MEKIIAVTFDIADQQCITYNALEWHNFIADTREQCGSSLYDEEDVETLSLEELFEGFYGDEFWFDIPTQEKIYDVAFDLTTEEFVYCQNASQAEAYQDMAEEGEYAEEVFWAE
jgi:hypothetical protein